MDPEFVAAATPPPVDASAGWNTAVAVLTDLLQKATDGAVSSQAVRKELENRGVPEVRQLVARLKAADFESPDALQATIRWHHFGRSFLTTDAFREAQRSQELPKHLLEGLSPSDADEVAVWWTTLSNANKLEVARFCDPREEDYFFGAIEENDDEGPLPRVKGGRFVPKSDTTGWADWYAELFEYLVCNPELVFIAPPVVRTFHICTHHEAIRAVLKTGNVPPDFQCPLGLGDCPMRHRGTLVVRSMEGGGRHRTNG
jgi:hypothetical protein